MALRNAIRIGLLGICLAGFSAPGVLWSLEVDAASAAAEEEKGQEPAHELLFKTINFLLLAVGLGYILRKPAVEFFRTRSASIHKALEEGRKALAASEAQLRAVEQKLQRLEEEIADFKASAAREMETERQRLQQAAAEESGRILESARAQTDAAVRAATLELKNYAAQQAVARAAALIHERLDASGRRRLVSQFAATLHSGELKN